MWISMCRCVDVQGELCDRLLMFAREMHMPPSHEACVAEGHGTTDVSGAEPGSPGYVQDGCFTRTEPAAFGIRFRTFSW